MGVDRIVHLEGTVAVHNESVDTSPRGWYEASVHYVDVEKHSPNEVIVHCNGLPDFVVSEELLEAALELLREEE